MSRTILDLMIKELHFEPLLLNSPLSLKEKIEKNVGHKINTKSFFEKYNLLFLKEDNDITQSSTRFENKKTKTI